MDKDLSVSGNCISNGEVNKDGRVYNTSSNIKWGDIGYSGTLHSNSTYIDNDLVWPNSSITYTTFETVFNTTTAKEKAIEFLSKHEVTRKILSRIEDVACIGGFSYEYDYSDDYEKGIWHQGIVDYFESVLEFDVDINLKTKRFFISWDL